jgi:FkbM family methyltransferase
MRLKEFFYLLGLKPSINIFPSRTDVVRAGNYEANFQNWLTPKAGPYQLDLAELEELKTFIRQGDVAIDVGAHIGDSTLPIALACGESGEVYAFEPNPMTFQVLAINAALNPKKTNIIPYPFAAAESAQTLWFDYGDPWLSNGGSHQGVSKWKHGSAFTIPVQGANIAQLLLEKHEDSLSRLRYIKIDVEGHDFLVVKILQKLIIQYRPYIKMELSWITSQKDREDAWSFFSEYNYEVRIVQERRKLFGRVAIREDFFCDETIDCFAIPKEKWDGT